MRRPWPLMFLLSACETEGVLVDHGEGEQAYTLRPGDVVRFESLELVVPETGFGVGLVAETDDGWVSLELSQQEGDVTIVLSEAGSQQCNRITATCSECRDYGGANCCTPSCPSGYRTVGTKSCTYLNRSTAQGACMEGRLTCEQCYTVPPGDAGDPCTDTAFRLIGRKWVAPLGWSFNPANVPAALDVGRVETVLQAAAGNLTGARNDCGRADAVSAQHTYRGRTSAGIGVSTTATSIRCGGRNGASVVGFGAMSGFKAATCWYWNSAQRLIEADIKFNQGVAWTATSSIPDGCTDALDLESVATHEFGHAFGLLHPGADHPHLTMQPGAACDRSKRTLGLGDLLGLEELY